MDDLKKFESLNLGQFRAHLSWSSLRSATSLSHRATPHVLKYRTSTPTVQNMLASKFTLKKEERRGKEEEGEEERERRRTIKRRERERGNSIVRSDNHLIVTETPQLFSEVNDSSSLPVTEASLVVEASTVVNYDKKELA